MSGSDRAESPLFVKTRDFMGWLFQHTAKFPKVYRHTLTNRLEESMLDFHRCLGVAALTGDEVALARADVELWQLRQLLRLANDMGFFPARLMEYSAPRLAELGSLLGGWRRKTGAGT
ncbi:MAG: four helix bundle protein [bacterium]